MIKRQSLLFIISVLLIFPLPQLAIDLYLPSLPAMTNFFHTPNSDLQLSLTVYIFSLGIAQLIYGPCSDRFGRKPMLLIGIAIFLVGTTACTMTYTITQLLVFRFVQGLGMGCGFAVASAVISDSFKHKELARMTTLSSMIYSSSPILAPIFGGYFQHYFGWQANFIIMIMFALIVLIAIFKFIPETNQNIGTEKINLIKTIKLYFSMLQNINFIKYIAVLTLTFGIIVTFNVIAPFLIQDTFRVSSVNYGKLLLIVGFCYFLGTFLNKYLLLFFHTNLLIGLGTIVIVFANLGLVLSGSLGWFTVISVMIFSCCTMIGAGLVFPNCFAKALEFFPHSAGAASALIGSAILIGTSAISAIIPHIQVYQNSILGYLLLTQSLLISALLIKRKKIL